MKLAFSTLACPGWDIRTAAEAARELEYDAIELRLLDGAVIDPTRDAERVRRAAAICRELGVAICAADSSCAFNHPDAGRRDAAIEEALAWIALAAELDIPLVRVFGGIGDPEDDPSAANARVAGCLHAIAPEAERRGVTVALETHDAFSSARRVAAVLDHAPSPRIGGLWDSHHPYRMGESAREVIAALGPRLAHVHVKDARRTDPEGMAWQLVLAGEGEVPITQQLQELEAAGYTGYVSVEWEKKWHPEIAEPEIALPQHITYLRSLLTQDPLSAHS